VKGLWAFRRRFAEARGRGGGNKTIQGRSRIYYLIRPRALGARVGVSSGPLLNPSEPQSSILRILAGARTPNS